MRRIISRYTREAGVRQLERALGRVARKVAVNFAESRQEAVVVRSGDLAEMLGPPRFFLPAENEKDLDEIPQPVRDELQFIPVDRIEDALAAAIPEMSRRLPLAAAI